MQERLNMAINSLDIPLENISIGIQKEKVLHKIIKYYLSLDPLCHEIKIGKNYIDVVVDDKLYEVQTQNFNKLRAKLDNLLQAHKLTIVYPCCRYKQIYNINEQGEYIKMHKSPKKGTPFQILVEMYKIRSYLNNPNLSFQILYIDMDEYREIVPKKHYRSKGYIRYKQFPVTIVNEYNLNCDQDYIKILKEFACPEEFTTTEFSRCFKISRAKSSSAVLVLASLGVVELLGKRGRSNLWKIKKCKTK